MSIPKHSGPRQPLIGVAGALALAGLACSSPQRSDPNKYAHDRPLSVDQHVAEAERHSRVADAEEDASATGSEQVVTRCQQDAVESQTRIGTEPIRLIHPCFTSVTNPTADHLREARENRIEARKHRNAASGLVKAENRACVGLDAESLVHSPFYHHEDILSIGPLEESGAAIGVRVIFKEVRGLTKDWLTRALQCHQARAAALGYSSDYMTPHCLCSVEGAESVVTEHNGLLHVDVRGANGAGAATILAKALALEALRTRPKMRQ